LLKTVSKPETLNSYFNLKISKLVGLLMLILKRKLDISYVLTTSVKGDHQVPLQNQEKKEGEDALSGMNSSTGAAATQLLRRSQPPPLLTVFMCTRRAATSTESSKQLLARLYFAPASL
jgi:hypothetical protein